MEGFLLIDKPAGPTSHDMVDRARRATGERKVGHAGTLDPFATGLLIIGVGRAATREMQRLSGLDKTYEAVFVLGAASDTDDPEGTVDLAPLPEDIDEQKIREAMRGFLGEIEQIPPAYSAVKVAGKRLYKAAREGKAIKAEPRRVRVDRFELVGQPERDGGIMRVRVVIDCGKGTYVRALARDLGAALGTAGYAEELRRTRIGPYSVDETVDLENPEPAPVKDFLERLP